MTTFFSNSDTNQLGQYVVDILTLQAQRIADEQETLTIALPGGTSPLCVYDKWIAAQFFPWKSVHFFFTDERLVPASSEQNNFTQTNKKFFQKLLKKSLITEKQIHPFDTSISTDQAVDNYQKNLDAHNGIFDIVLLGAGEDGHTAALFPKHESLVSSENFVTIDDSPKPPAQRMTCTPQLLKQAQVGILLIIGAGKHPAQMQYLNPNVSTADCPLKIINEIERSYVVTQFEL